MVSWKIYAGYFVTKNSVRVHGGARINSCLLHLAEFFWFCFFKEIKPFLVFYTCGSPTLFHVSLSAGAKTVGFLDFCSCVEDMLTCLSRRVYFLIFFLLFFNISAQILLSLPTLMSRLHLRGGSQCHDNHWLSPGRVGIGLCLLKE